MSRVNIIGAGLAGLSAAIALAERNIECSLISLQPSERAQSVLAEGGINAALDTMGEHDTPAEHCADTLRGGVELADPQAVRALTGHAPEIVLRLSRLGVPFQQEGERLILRNFGGQKKKRTAYARSSTGKALMTALIDEARKYEFRGLIHRYPHHAFRELRLRDGRCAGALVSDTYTGALLEFPGPVLLACGGLNGLFPGLTTGATQNDGNAAAALFAQGVPFANLEFIQYHPTTVRITGKRLLVSEAARGEGGRLFIRRGGEPWYFMEETYPELGNLMPRDVISREMVRVCAREDCEDQVYLDLTGLPRQTWAKKLPDLRQELISYLGLDPAKEPVPVSPGIHFFMGGVRVDARHRSPLPGLYAAGECACQYHGANRLGGNSMLAALYGGQVAAESAAEDVPGEDGLPRALPPAAQETQHEWTVSPACAAQEAEILYAGLGILRSGEGMRAALAALGEVRAETEMERKRLLLGEAMLRCALARQESRGAHTRTDFPERDDARYRRSSVARLTDGAIALTLEALPERSEA